MTITTEAPTPTRTAVRPTGIERSFGADELIVSKTDRRGVITYANDVFCRVGAYDLDEVIGRPHNLIRHPDMPRAVFALLWETISSGQELFAYINNLAKDGANYWVLAHVTPSFDERGQIIGYHSNRRRPSPGALAKVRPLYAQLREEERRHSTAKAAVAASSQLLDQLVHQRAASYEELVWSVIGSREV